MLRQSKYLRETLDSWRASRGLRWADIARDCNFVSANRFYNLVNDANKFSLSMPAYLSISKTYNVSIDELVGNIKFTQESSETPKLLVLAKAQSGNFQASPYLPTSQQYSVALPVKHQDVLKGAYCIEHLPGSNKGDHALKDILIVRPFIVDSDQIYAPLTVIVHRTDSKGVEILVGEIRTQEADLVLEFPVGSQFRDESRFVIKKDGRISSAKGKNISVLAIVLGRWQTFKREPQSIRGNGKW